MKFRLVLAILSLCFSAHISLGQAANRSLWIDVTALDFAAQSKAGALLEQPINRLIVPGFVGGATLFPDPPQPFSQMPAYRGKADPIPPLLARAHAKGQKVYLFLDCLHWTLPGVPADQDILAKQSSWAARDLQGRCSLPVDGKYASPFHPAVRLALLDLVRALPQRYPDLDGVLLECRLPLGISLGFEETARAAYIEAAQIDPIDILPGGSDPEQTLYAEWARWRRQQVGDLVQKLSAAFKRGSRIGKVAALGYANWYRLNPVSRTNSLEDWLGWVVSQSVDEVILECRWDKGANAGSYAFCKSLFAKTHKSVPHSVLVAVSERHEMINIEKATAIFRGQQVPGFVMRVRREEEIAVASRFWQTGLTALEASLPGAQLANLRNDTRLHVKLDLTSHPFTIKDVLGQLEKRTGLVFSLDPKADPERPALQHLTSSSVPAWFVMDQLASSLEAYWHKTPDGYALSAPEKVPDASPLENPSAIRGWLITVALVLSSVVALLLTRYYWRKVWRGVPST